MTTANDADYWSSGHVFYILVYQKNMREMNKAFLQQEEGTHCVHSCLCREHCLQGAKWPQNCQSVWLQRSCTQ